MHALYISIHCIFEFHLLCSQPASSAGASSWEDPSPVHVQTKHIQIYLDTQYVQPVHVQNIAQPNCLTRAWLHSPQAFPWPETSAVWYGNDHEQPFPPGQVQTFLQKSEIFPDQRKTCELDKTRSTENTRQTRNVQLHRPWSSWRRLRDNYIDKHKWCFFNACLAMGLDVQTTLGSLLCWLSCSLQTCLIG